MINLRTFATGTQVESYYSTELSDKVKNHNSTKNFVKKIGDLLEQQIIEHDGIKFNMDHINLGGDRPQFTDDSLNGLKILINNNEHTLVNIKDVSYDLNTGDWSASVYLTIIDHFGLDENDLLTYQNKNLGFASWWLLQHARGYVPFRTHVKVKYNIKGNTLD